MNDRQSRLTIFIPPEASNLSNEEYVMDNSHLQELAIARKRRTLSLTRILEPSFHEPFFFLYISVPDGVFSTEEENDFSERIEFLVRKMNQLRPHPKFVAICGGLMGSDSKTDIIDFERTKRFGEALSRLNIDTKVIYVPSIADFSKYKKRASIEKYRSVYGEDWYSFWVCGVSFLVVNSLYFQAPIDNDIESFKTEQEDWIDSELIKQQIFDAKWTMVLQDRPNTSNESNEIGDGFKCMERFRNSGVSHIFCHQSDDEWPKELEPDSIAIIVNKMGKHSEPNWCVRLVKVYAENIEHSCVSLDDFPEKIEL